MYKRRVGRIFHKANDNLRDTGSDWHDFAIHSVGDFNGGWEADQVIK